MDGLESDGAAAERERRRYRRGEASRIRVAAQSPVGRFKARFFAALGFTAEAWPVFEQALRAQHLTQDASPMGIDVHGQAFTIRAILQGPTGASALVVSVWFVRAGEAVPRFVTAYPGGAQ